MPNWIYRSFKAKNWLYWVFYLPDSQFKNAEFFGKSLLTYWSFKKLKMNNFLYLNSLLSTYLRESMRWFKTKKKILNFHENIQNKRKLIKFWCTDKAAAKALDFWSSLLGIESRLRTIFNFIKNAKNFTKFRGKQWETTSVKNFLYFP